MAAPTKIRLRNLWLSIHGWIGLLLAALIIPISVSGSALVWHDALDQGLNPEREVHSGPARLPFDAYLAAARSGLAPQDRIASIALPQEEGAVVVVGARAPEG
ncbi:MAG TPA: PepSY-associated TM helix domain-containing protein, partial [Allosphingosinicella sp.]